jgi:peroxiredoxin
VSEKSQRKKDGKAAVRSREAARARARLMALVITAALVVVVIAGAVILYVRASGRAAPAASSAALPSTAGKDGAAPAGSAVTDLEKAADAVGFQVTTGANVGVIENMPSDTTLVAPSGTLLPVGSTAPDFTLSAPDGKLVKLSQYRGKTVFLEFFATWCPHCQAEAPHLLQVYNSLPSSNVVFLSVNGDSEDAASVHAFTRHFGLPWGVYLDPGSPAGSFSQQGGVGPVSRAYGLALFPTFYVIDPRGRIAWRADREQPDSLILAKLRDVSGS